MTDAYSKASVGYDRISEVLETENEICDLPNARKAPRFKGDIEFENVTFCYRSDSPVLQNVSFEIKAGQVAALVGPTTENIYHRGLIPRFYDPVRVSSKSTARTSGSSSRSHCGNRSASFSRRRCCSTPVDNGIR